MTISCAPWVPSGVTRVEPSTANSDVEWLCASRTVLVTEPASESVALRTKTFEILSSPLPSLTRRVVRRASLQPLPAIPTTTVVPIRTAALDITCVCGGVPAFDCDRDPVREHLGCCCQAHQTTCLLWYDLNGDRFPAQGVPQI